MTHTKQLAKQVRFVAVGYLLLYLHMKINGFDLLPDVLGWALFWLAIRGLREARPKIALLSGFAAALGVQAAAEWLQIWALPDWLGIVNVTLTVVHIYFDFHLLTELAGLAEDYRETLGGVDHSRGLLRARAAMVVLRTCFSLITALPLPEGILTAGIWVVSILQLIFAFLMVVNLFGLAKGLERVG